MNWEDVLFEALQATRPPQYGTSMHWPYCLGRGCTGCLPPIDVPARPCAPAIGVHRSGCDCTNTLRVSDLGPQT